MEYYYSTVNQVVMTHSAIEEKERKKRVQVQFRRPAPHGFDIAYGTLPSHKFHTTFGFSEEELEGLWKYMKNNAPLIWEFAGKGGGMNA